MSKLAVVSGGSRGLGAALCDAFDAADYELIELSRTATRPYSVRADFGAPAAACDALRAAIAATLTRAGPPDEVVVVANAATLDPIGSTPCQSTEAIVRNLQVNFVGAVAFVAAAVGALQDLPARKRAIVIGSGAASNLHAGLSLYGAAKAGLEQYIRTLAVEQAVLPWPFVVVTADPGALDTGMQAALRGVPASNFPGAADFAARHARGALRDTRDAAAAILRLACSGTLEGGQRYRV